MRVRVVELIVAAAAVAVLLAAMVPGVWPGTEPLASQGIHPDVEVPRPPVKLVKAIYLTSWSAATPKRLKHAVQLTRDTELNAVVIDVKDFSGKVFFETSSPLISRLKSVEPRLGDLRSMVERLHENGVYVIVRIAVFQDQHLLNARPDLAIRNGSGEIWRDRLGLGWVDPASEEVWRYTVEIAREAAAAGVDELNFDYIRFPSDGNVDDIHYPIFDNTTRTRRQVIHAFFVYLTSELRSAGAVLSADVFGLVTVRSDDMGIGQVLEDALIHFDVVSPMVYPSHYGQGFMQYRNPAAQPYEVVRYSLEKAAERRLRLFESLMALTPSGYPTQPEIHVAAIRPWLQAFDLGAPYPPSAIRTQMKATTDAGFYDGWLLWSAANIYAADSFIREPQRRER